MQPPHKRQLVITPFASEGRALAPGIAAGLGAFEETRLRTWGALEGVSAAELDWNPSVESGTNSLGTLLYHLAAIEADWVYADLVQQWPAELAALFPWDVRDAQGRLTVVTGLSLNEHKQRLERVRAFTVEAYAPMSAEAFQQTRSNPDYDVTPEWVLHHLMQHEAAHRGEMGVVRELFRHSFDAVL